MPFFEKSDEMSSLPMVHHLVPRQFLTAPPSTFAQLLPSHLKMPNPPGIWFVPVIHAEPSAPTPMSFANPGISWKAPPARLKIW
jgi:hypothetical protein